MIYQCNYPLCSYQTSSRTHIHYHHIVPKELGGSNDDSNRVFLCPTHHTCIHVPELVDTMAPLNENQHYGHHAKVNELSIILIGWRKSTAGRVLLYHSVNNITEICIEADRNSI